MSSAGKQSEFDLTKQALQDFLLDIDCLNDLEKWMNRFNIFDILKITRTEIRHSNMLAWLLNPSENHGLGAQVLEGLLRYIIHTSISNQPVLPLMAMDLNEVLVHRELYDIDILIVSPENRFVLCIENKIDAKEHGKQLQKYKETIERIYSGYDSQFIFLTPSGIDSSNPQFWLPMSYGVILEILEPIVERSSLSDDARMLIDNYLEIIRRVIVDDQELVEVCQKIYSKHRRALDILFENRPDKAFTVFEILKSWAEEKADNKEILQFDPSHSSKSYTRFHTPYMSELFPDSPGTRSAWNTPSHYFWEIVSEGGDSIYLKLTFNSTQMTEEQRKLVETICQICKKEGFGKKEKLNANWGYRTQFSTSRRKIGDDIDSDKIKEQLDGFLEQAKKFENELEGKLKQHCRS